ncbi:MAG: TRAP transporter small permease [Oscillospiraceae bacterium]|nr:TRAP transporter small permease [Oscillospiraceae bacterium]
MLKKTGELLIKIQKNFGGFVMLVILVCCLLQVMFRMLNLASPWTEEFSRVGIAYLTFLMAALGVRLNAHPSVDFLVRRLPKRLRFSLKIFTELLIVLVGLIFVVYGWQYFLRTMGDHATTYHYAKAWWYWPIPVSGVVTVIYSVRNIIYLVISIIRNEDCTGFIPSEAEQAVESAEVKADRGDET